MLVHRRRRAHTVEALVLFAVLLDDFTATLIVSGQHAAQHDEIGAGTERLRHIARIRAAT